MGWGEGVAVATGQPLGDLLSAIERFCGDFSAATEPADLGTLLVQLRAGIDRLEYVFSLTATTFACTDEYED